MKLLAANKRMIARYAHELEQMGGHSCHPSLCAILSAGLVEQDGCVLLAAHLPQPHIKRSDCGDSIGYECLINHLHLEDSVSGNLVANALCYLRLLSTELSRRFPQRQFMGVIAADDNDRECNVRFHTPQPGRSWLADNLDAYDECVCVMQLGSEV